MEGISAFSPGGPKHLLSWLVGSWWVLDPGMQNGQMDPVWLALAAVTGCDFGCRSSGQCWGQ